MKWGQNFDSEAECYRISAIFYKVTVILLRQGNFFYFYDFIMGNRKERQEKCKEEMQWTGRKGMGDVDV